MKSLLRAGIVGGGFMAEVHARAIRAAGHDVVGIAASTRDSTRSIADRMRVPQAFDSGTALIDSIEIDVIHAEQSARKPITGSSGEGQTSSL
jgi:predicted dehydrogenase